MTRTATQQRYDVEMADGATFTVRHTNPDRLRWDDNARRHGWGPATDSPFLAQTFVTWAAAKREGHTELGWEAFREACLEITPVEVDPEVDVIRPTSRAASAPSS